MADMEVKIDEVPGVFENMDSIKKGESNVYCVI